jgi:transglutaminase-like putative cysteine protease
MHIHFQSLRVGLTRAALATALLATLPLASIAHAGEEPFPPMKVVSRNEVTLDFKPDATHSVERFQCIRIARPQDIDRFSKLDLSFQPDLETVEILDAYTLTPNGKRLDVSPAHIQEHDSNDSDTGFNDDREISVVYPEVTVGSQVCRRYRRQDIKPILPGYDSSRLMFAPQIRWEHTELAVRAPANYQVQGRGLQGGLVNEADGVRHYRFHFEQLQARKENSGIDLLDFAPGLLISSAKDYSEIARISWQDFKPAVAPTDAIRRLAQDLTKDIKSPRDKARALYHWVNKNIRYSDISIGRGGWAPKSADAVLKDKHGDCKGMSVLMVALLAAVGIDSTPALISTDEVYQLPTVPVLYFDHVITYIPSLDLFLDATAKQTPFAVLDTQNQGKPTLLLASAEVKYTPFEKAHQARQNSLTLLTVLESGEIGGSSIYRPIGSPESSSRSTHFENKAMPPSRVINETLNQYHETGTGKIKTPDPDDLEAEWVVRADFRLDPVTNIPGPGAMRIPVGVAAGTLYRISTYRYDPVPPDRPSPCTARLVVEKTHLDFPKTVRITRLPPDVAVRDGLASYQAYYTLNSQLNRVTAERQYVLTPAARLCSATEYQSRQRIHKVLQRDMRQQVFYE